MVVTEALALTARNHQVPSEATSDEDLARRAQRGDMDAFSALVERYQKGVVNLAYRLVGDWDTALDLSQDIFVKVYQRLHTFDTQRPFKPWLYRIATNHCYDYLRRLGRERMVISEEEIPIRTWSTDRTLDPEDQVLQSEIQHTVETLVATLPPQYRAVLTLRYLEHLSYKEISEILGIPMGTVKTHIHRARNILKSALTEKGILP